MRAGAVCVSCGGGRKPDSGLTGGAVHALPTDRAFMVDEAGLVAIGRLARCRGVGQLGCGFVGASALIPVQLSV